MDETTVDGTVPPLQAGDPRRLGSYDLIGRLGVGGQGAVFLGRSPSGDRVAIKLLHADLTEDTEARGRFVREAMAAKKVARFCAAQVLDVEVAGDRPYIVSEYVPGPSLYGLVKDNGPLSGGSLERLAIGTATALVAIHQAGIVHRDLKPANVLIGPDGPRVIDFGIAKALANTATATSRVLGTPAYMAPEQIRGGTADPSVDVFAWGAMMAFVATGRPPFGTDSIPLVVQRILAAEPDLGDMAEPLRGLVRDCLAKEPAGRPTARQVLLRLLGQEELGLAAAPAGGAAGPGAGPERTAVLTSDVADVTGVAPGGAVAADVLAQAATIAAVRTPTGRTAPGGRAAPGGMAAADGMAAASAPTAALMGSGPGDAGTLPVLPHTTRKGANGPVAPRSNLSRAFVIAGLAAVVIAILALLLTTMRPYGMTGGPSHGGTPSGTPAGQSEPLNTTSQNGQPLVNGESRQPSTGTEHSAGTSPSHTPQTGTDTGTGNSGTGHTGHPTTTPTPTHTSATPTVTPTPSETPSTTSTESTGGGTGGGTDGDAHGGAGTVASTGGY
jgi:hypothetical protein